MAINSYLFQIKYIESDVCTKCHYEKETITHLFWNCIYTCINPLWGEFAAWYICIMINSQKNIVLDIVDILFETSNASATLDMCYNVLFCIVIHLYVKLCCSKICLSKFVKCVV